MPNYRFLPFTVRAKWEKGEGQPSEESVEVRLLDADAMGRSSSARSSPSASLNRRGYCGLSPVDLMKEFVDDD